MVNQFMNKVTRNEPLEYTKFENLNDGDLFFCENKTFIKMDQNDAQWYSACSLSDGTQYSFPNSKLVTTVTTVTLERESTSIEM